MKYAKLISGGIVSSAIPKSGYKPFVETVPETRDGYNSYAEYVDDGDVITTVWHYAEQTDQEKENPESETYPAWDIRSSTSFAVGDRVTSEGTVYECIKAHNASWTRQPPNAECWRTL